MANRILIFGPRRTVAFTGPIEESSAIPVPPPAVATSPPSRHLWGIGSGSALIWPGPNTDNRPVVAPITQVIHVARVEPPRSVFAGGAIVATGMLPSLANPAQVAFSNPPPPYQGDGRSISGYVPAVSTTFTVMPPIMRVQEPRYPDPGQAVTRIGSAGSDSMVPRATPPIVTTKPFENVPPGLAIAISGVEAPKVFNPTFVAQSEPWRPESGSAITSLGGVDSGSAVPRGTPVAYSQAWGDPWPPYQGYFSSQYGVQRDVTPKPASVWSLENRPGEGYAHSLLGRIPEGETKTPNRPVVAFRSDDGVWQRVLAGSVTSVRFQFAYGITQAPPRVIDVVDIDHVIADEFNIGDNGVPTANQVFFVGDNWRFQVKNVTRDGAAWTLTSATLKLVNPAGTVTSYAASFIEAGVWGYDTVTADLGTAGQWRRYWVLSDGSVSLTYHDWAFVVRDVS